MGCATGVLQGRAWAMVSASGDPDFLLHLPQVSRITQRAWEEQDDKTGLSCSLLLLPSGGVERHHRQILMGDLHPKGRWQGGCGICKWRS